MKNVYLLCVQLPLVAALHSTDTAMCQPSSSAAPPDSCCLTLQAHPPSRPVHRRMSVHCFSRIMLGCISSMEVPELLHLFSMHTISKIRDACEAAADTQVCVSWGHSCAWHVRKRLSVPGTS